MKDAAQTYAFLALRLLAPYAPQNLSPENSAFQVADEIAKGIIANPQFHIDALVAAGVLRHKSDLAHEHCWYEVVQPHVHEWRISAHGDQFIALTCSVCGTVDPKVPNRLPIEVPE